MEARLATATATIPIPDPRECPPGSRERKSNGARLPASARGRMWPWYLLGLLMVGAIVARENLPFLAERPSPSDPVARKAAETAQPPRQLRHRLDHRLAGPLKSRRDSPRPQARPAPAMSPSSIAGSSRTTASSMVATSFTAARESAWPTSRTCRDQGKQNATASGPRWGREGGRGCCSTRASSSWRHGGRSARTSMAANCASCIGTAGRSATPLSKGAGAALDRTTPIVVPVKRCTSRGAFRRRHSSGNSLPTRSFHAGRPP